MCTLEKFGAKSQGYTCKLHSLWPVWEPSRVGGQCCKFRGSRLGYFAQSKDSGPIREVVYATLRVWGECVNNQDSGDLSCKYWRSLHWRRLRAWFQRERRRGWFQPRQSSTTTRLEHLRARLGRDPVVEQATEMETLTPQRKLGRGLEETVTQSRLDQGEEEGVCGGSRWSETSRDGERLGHGSGTQRARTRVQGSEVLWSLYLGRTLERTCNAGWRSRAHLDKLDVNISAVCHSGVQRPLGEDKDAIPICWPV